MSPEMDMYYDCINALVEIKFFFWSVDFKSNNIAEYLGFVITFVI